jgi:hypothetical protein
MQRFHCIWFLAEFCVATSVVCMCIVKFSCDEQCYVQWDNLKRNAVAAFQHFNISCITLDGNPEVIRGKVSQFQQPIATAASWMQQPRVLLCRCEHTVLTPCFYGVCGTKYHARCVYCRSPFVFAGSLKLKAAGLNLHVANHVLLLHPFFSLNLLQVTQVNHVLPPSTPSSLSVIEVLHLLGQGMRVSSPRESHAARAAEAELLGSVVA